jgi:hypothetical protein
MNVCRHMIQGVDVWLNNPRRPLEASGTSGQKTVLNGGLNLSILDGWWAEAYDGTNGFAIGHGTSHRRRQGSPTAGTRRIPVSRAIEDEVVPMYYDRDVDGLPRHWIKRMMNSISTRWPGDSAPTAWWPTTRGTATFPRRGASAATWRFTRAAIHLCLEIKAHGDPWAFFVSLAVAGSPRYVNGGGKLYRLGKGFLRGRNYR